MTVCPERRVGLGATFSPDLRWFVELPVVRRFDEFPDCSQLFTARIEIPGTNPLIITLCLS
jgi:hypothetical protein